MLIKDSLTEFPELNEILRELAERAAAILGDNFVGAYLQGSFAVGNADQFSDVDFLIPTHGLITRDQEVQLRAMHAEFPDRGVSWARHLEGSYPLQDELRTLDAVGKTWLYVDNGAREMGWSAHDNTAVTRWSLREHGIVLTGPEPKAVVDPVGADDLRGQALTDANRFMATLRKSAVELDNAWLQPYIVTTFCRFLHTLDCGKVTSKQQALLWARNHLDRAWSDIIQQALDDRPDPWGRVGQPARPGTLQETLRFAKYGESIAKRYSRAS